MDRQRLSRTNGGRVRRPAGRTVLGDVALRRAQLPHCRQTELTRSCAMPDAALVMKSPLPGRSCSSSRRRSSARATSRAFAGSRRGCNWRHPLPPSLTATESLDRVATGATTNPPRGAAACGVGARRSDGRGVRNHGGQGSDAPAGNCRRPAHLRQHLLRYLAHHGLWQRSPPREPKTLTLPPDRRLRPSATGWFCCRRQPAQAVTLPQPPPQARLESLRQRFGGPRPARGPPAAKIRSMTFVSEFAYLVHADFHRALDGQEPHLLQRPRRRASPRTACPPSASGRYYEAKARGGVGFMMCFGSASVHPTSPARDWNGVELFDDRVIPHLQKFADTMHRYGVPVRRPDHPPRPARAEHRHLWNRHVRPQRRPRAEPPRERRTPSTPATMEEFVRAFADAAGRLQAGRLRRLRGDGQPLPPHRPVLDAATPTAATDEYGGDLANRLRFGVRVLEAVRERVGRDFIVGIRMTGDDFVEGGLDNADMPGDRRPAQRAGAARLLQRHRRLGRDVRRRGGRRAGHVVPARRVCPLGGRHSRRWSTCRSSPPAAINDPVQADKLIAEGQADLCIMNRALIADPDFPNKARRGPARRHPPVHGLQRGLHRPHLHRPRRDLRAERRSSAARRDWAELPPATSRRKVVVVGGGPAGLECARVAAACAAITSCCSRRIDRARRADADRQAGARPAGLRRRQPLVEPAVPQAGRRDPAELRGHRRKRSGRVARRGRHRHRRRGRVPKLPGMEQHRSSPAGTCCRARPATLGRVVLVIDEEYGHQGPTTAEFLLDRGQEVDLITSQETIGNFLGATTTAPAAAAIVPQTRADFQPPRGPVDRERLPDRPQHLVGRVARGRSV